MKKASIFILIFFLNNLLLTGQTDLSEGWEITIMKERQPPKKIMGAIGIKKDMVIGEIGAGKGRFTVYLAREVGPRGKIYANDIDTNSIHYLEKRIHKLGFKNVITIAGKPDDPLLPDNSLDLAIMVWVYHMIDKPDELLNNLKHSLKTGAKLVILDPVDSEVDQEFHIDRNNPNNKVPTIKERIEKSAINCGYKLEKVETFLPKDVIYILKIKE